VRAAYPPCPHPPPGAALWSEAATWPNGTLPAAGDCVVIPAGKTVWLDVSPPPLGGVTIDGALRFECRDLALTADSIVVHGTLEVGSTNHPFHRRATLTLTHDFVCGTEPRTLAVEDGGTLRLIGAAHGESWLRLDRTVAAGSTQVRFDRDSGWQSGDRIVIASTDYDGRQAEVRTLVATSGRNATLDQPLAWQHYGDFVATNVDGVGVDERAEIGLLSRPIVVRGLPLADPQGRVYSGSVVARGAGLPPALEIAWTAFQDLGDEGIADRSPLMLDSLGEASSSYVRSTSFERSSNRAITLRDTDHLRIEDCVAYDTTGHAFYVEDFASRGAVFRRNLGLLTRSARPGFATTPSDLVPATFWLRHPDALCEDDVAAGSDGYGFELEVADGETTPQKWFARNVAHSCAEIGFFQDRRPRPSSASLWTDLVAWKNRRYGVWWRSYGSAQLVGLRAADNRGGVYLASEGIPNDFVQTHGIADLRMTGGLVIGESENHGNPTSPIELAAGRSLPQRLPNAPALHLPDWDVLCGVEVYDGLLFVDGTRFANFADLVLPGLLDRPAGAFSQVQHASPWAVDPRNHVANVSFVNARRVRLRTPVGVYSSNPVLADDGIANTVIVDDDGSLTGLAGTRVFPSHGLLEPRTGATFSYDWNALVALGAPAAPFAQLELANWQPTMTGVFGPAKLKLLRLSNGGSATLVQPIYGAPETQTNRFTANVTTGDVYAYEYDPATPVSQWSTAFSISLQFTEPGRSVQISVPLPPVQTGSVEIDGAPGVPAMSLSELANLPSGWFYDATTGRVHVKLTTTGSGSTLLDGARTTATIVAN
jgi:cell migration-inducing and hyaluronan-binding protein